jgi:hypothetical protein
MATGIQDQREIVADTETILYTIPTEKKGTYTLSLTNNTSDSATVEIWFTTTTTSLAKRYANEVFERSIFFNGLHLAVGQKVIIKVSKAATSTLKGVEGAI